MNDLLFERCLVYFVNLRATERFKSDTEFADKVFADTASPVNTWRAIRNGQKGGFRKVSVREAWKMADVLGMSVDTLFFKIVKELEEGWTMEQDISKQQKKAAGRPPKELSLKNTQKNKKTYIRGSTPTSIVIPENPIGTID